MPSLFLCPNDLLWQPPDVDAFACRMRDLGLAGSLWPSGSAHEYLAGEEFLKLVMFLGCSPQVVLDPATAVDGQAVCAVRLVEFGEPVLLASHPLPAARCRKCRAPVSLPASVEPDALYSCKHCGNQSSLGRLDWRQGAGYGRFFLELSAIYPHEAVPSDKLLLELQAISCCKWAYFYAHR